MPQLSTGLVIAGAYADKVRRTLFAQLRDMVKSGEITNQEVARAAAELNRFLYNIIVERLRVDKGDVVRARIEYEIEDGKISWKYDTLTLEAFRRVPDDEVNRVVQEAKERVEQILTTALAYTIEHVVDTALGDKIYRLKIDDRHVGSFVVTPIDEDAVLVKGAVLEPSPVIIDRARISLAGASIEEALQNNMQNMISAGRHVEASEARKALDEIEAIIEKETGTRLEIKEEYEGEW